MVDEDKTASAVAVIVGYHERGYGSDRCQWQIKGGFGSEVVGEDIKSQKQ